MSPSNARRKQLQKLAERRAAERRRQRRQRTIAIVTAFVVLAAGGTVLFFALTGNDDGAGPVAGPSATPTTPDIDPQAAACGAEIPPDAGKPKEPYDAPPEMQIDTEKTYTATMTTSCGVIEIELFADQAPKTVNNFVFLAREGFYDNTIFHRVIGDFMIQGGDPEGTGFGGPGYEFEDETDNGLVFDQQGGQLAMANSGPDSNGSQFFITVSMPSHLDGKHTIFGRVTKGYADVVVQINALPTNDDDAPLQTVFIESIEITES